ncbi:hypothetical protein CI109_102575 [Kwoniella shandongensis]|uniref:Uncharacterized protein n=1 Tax=Kwoniella shandongensis TaxID=1734106 RepID=A0A5M6BSG5_9TREE|nr:uncharacterized protein CI109_005808 [Kwoniella shandongensis]KAA5525786.1 hypothetical protein CI109_005808 [Kwoniella shandongensis]
MTTPSHPALNWPRTDADPSRWPETSPPSNTDWYYEEVPLSDPKYKLYEQKTGEYLAQKLGLPVVASQQRVPMPKHYKLYAHRKRQPDDSIRTDFYLFGSVNTLKFRSVPEFQEHAAWLMDTSRSLDDHSECLCPYSKSGKGRKSLSGSTKRGSSASPVKDAPPKKKKVAPAQSEAEEEDGLAGVVPERAEELTSQRRFRRGELVWFRINNIDPPAKLRGLGLTALTHWPGLIAQVPLKTRVLQSGDVASASSSTAWTLFGGAAPKLLASTQPDIVQYYEYHIRPLGMFSPADQIVKDGKDLLPWSIGSELLAGEKGWDAIGHQAENYLREGVKKEAEGYKGKSPEELEASAGNGQKWKANWAKRIRFVEMPWEWDAAVFRLSVALKTAHGITNAWTQTDKIDILPQDTDISEEDMKLIMSQKKTLYQGLWWGGERIWLEDMVRLKKHRSDLPTDSLLAPSEGAEDRAVFLKIRVIAIEVASEHAQSNETAWRCVLYGDVFELAKEGANDQLPTPATINGEIPVMSAYKAPEGFVYRQLNDPGSEVTCDIIDVAGRVYPDLLDGATQSWFVDPAKPTDVGKRVTPGDSTLALMGLKTGGLVASKSEEWKEDLYLIVQQSSKTCETKLKEWYVRLLRDALGLPKESKKENGTNGTAVNGGSKA